MSDLISRQDAIDALTESNLKRHMDSVKDGQENRSAIRIIMGLPSANRTGKWEKLFTGNYKCSFCGAWYKTCDDYGNGEDGSLDWNFCPNCGSFNGNMRGAEK